MDIRKPLTAAVLAATIIGGGVGTAAAADDVVDSAEVTEGEHQKGEGHKGRSGRVGRVFNTAADAIGIATDELRAELRDGATIASVAEANDVDVDAVVADIVASVEERFDAKVEAGDLTAEQADEKLGTIEERITNRVNGIESDRDEDGKRRRGHRGNRGNGADTEATA